MNSKSKTTKKANTLKLHSFALKASDKIILKSIDVVEDLQNLASKTIKHHLKYAEKQQDNFFENLEKEKGMIWKKLNKTVDFFSKN